MSNFLCPSCGADLPAKAISCRECGSDERTGWKSAEEVDHAAIELPEEDDYQQFLEREGLAPVRAGRAGRPKLWVVVTGILILAALVFSLVLL